MTNNKRLLAIFLIFVVLLIGIISWYIRKNKRENYTHELLEIHGDIGGTYSETPFVRQQVHNTGLLMQPSYPFKQREEEMEPIPTVLTHVIDDKDMLHDFVGDAIEDMKVADSIEYGKNLTDLERRVTRSVIENADEGLITIRGDKPSTRKRSTQDFADFSSTLIDDHLMGYKGASYKTSQYEDLADPTQMFERDPWSGTIRPGFNPAKMGDGEYKGVIANAEDGLAQAIAGIRDIIPVTPQQVKQIDAGFKEDMFKDVFDAPKKGDGYRTSLAEHDTLLYNKRELSLPISYSTIRMTDHAKPIPILEGDIEDQQPVSYVTTQHNIGKNAYGVQASPYDFNGRTIF